MKKQTPEEFKAYLEKWWEEKRADKIGYALQNLTTMDFEDFILANQDKELKGVKLFEDGYGVTPNPELEGEFVKWYVKNRIDATIEEKEAFFKKMELE